MPKGLRITIDGVLRIAFPGLLAAGGGLEDRQTRLGNAAPGRHAELRLHDSLETFFMESTVKRSAV